MNGGDVGLIQFQSVVEATETEQLRTDTLSQFCGSGLGKGHGHNALWCDQALNDPFTQLLLNGVCLTGSCSGRDNR